MRNKAAHLPGKCLLIVFFMILVQETYAQSDEFSKQQYAKAQRLLKDTTYAKIDSAVFYLQQAVTAEMKAGTQDEHFVLNGLKELADLYSYSKPYEYEYAFNYYGLLYSRNRSLQKEEDEMLKRLVKTCSKVKDENLPFQQSRMDTIAQIDDNFTFGVKEVLRQNQDSAWVIIDGGKNEGLYNDSRGTVFAVYNGEGRGNQYLGQCQITKTSWSQSEAVIIKAMKADSLSLNLIYPHDRLQLPVKVPASVNRGLIYDMSSLGIQFVTSSREPLYHAALLLHLGQMKPEESFIRQMLEDVHQTANWLLNDASLKNQFDEMIIEKGTYHGKELLLAMKESKEADIRAFLRFVKSFPAKYINQRFKITETYATWLLNNSPAASEIEPWFLEQLIQLEDTAVIRNFLELNEFYILQHESDEEIDIEAQGFSSLQMYKAGLHTRYAYDLFSENRKEDAFALLDKLFLLAEHWQNDTVRSWYTIQKGRLLEFNGDLKAAEESYEKVIGMKGLEWQGYWYRGLLKMNAENEFSALKDFEIVNELAAWFASAWGNRGWMLLKNGRPLPALEVCRKAFELDPAEMAWNVNLAHAYLFLDRLDSAKLMYQRTLDLLESEELFKSGPLADFDFFIKNGAKAEEMREQKNWMLREWDAHYQFKVHAKDLYNRGVAFHQTGQYDSARTCFEQAVTLEQQGRDTNHLLLRKYTRYLAYNFYKQRDYVRSLAAYKSALDIASHKLRDQDLILDDLDDVGNLHGWLGDDSRERMIRYQHKMLSRKRDEFTKNGNIYILSIGSNYDVGGGYKSAEKEAEIITRLLVEKTRKIYKEAHVVLLNEPTLPGDSLNKALLSMIKNAQPEDLFLLYYAGHASSSKAELSLWNDQVIEASFLLGKLDYLRCRKKLLFFDCDHGPFLDQLMSEFQSNAENLLKEQDLMLLAPANFRSEEPLSGNSFLTGALIDILQNPKGISPDDPLISSKELESALYRKYGREGAFHGLMSFSSGLDFHIAHDSSFSSNGKDNSPPIIKLFETNGMRGGKTAVLHEGGNIKIQGVVIDENAINSLVTDEGQLIGIMENGRFEASIPCNGKKQIILSATDAFGNTSREKLDISSVCQEQPKRNPKNIALLIGIDDYDEWEDLNNPVRDVLAIGKLLEENYSFETTYRFNLTKENMALLMDTFLKQTYLPEDQLLILIAGHGVFDPNYGGSLVCKDSKKNNATFTTYFKYSDLIMPFANKKELRNVLVVLDVCYGGELFNNNYSRRYLGKGSMDISQAAFIKRQKNALSKQFITSGGKEYVSDGAAGGHSPFAEMFIQTLQDRGPEQGFVVLSDFMDYTGKLPSSPQFGMFARAPVGIEEGDFIFEYKAPAKSRTISFGP